jgi:hypothetical protein
MSWASRRWGRSKGDGRENAASSRAEGLAGRATLHGLLAAPQWIAGLVISARMRRDPECRHRGASASDSPLTHCDRNDRSAHARLGRWCNPVLAAVPAGCRPDRRPRSPAAPGAHSTFMFAGQHQLCPQVERDREASCSRSLRSCASKPLALLTDRYDEDLHSWIASSEAGLVINSELSFSSHTRVCLCLIDCSDCSSSASRGMSRRIIGVGLGQPGAHSTGNVLCPQAQTATNALLIGSLGALAAAGCSVHSHVRLKLLTPAGSPGK